jgi:hypothetical protein
MTRPCASKLQPLAKSGYPKALLGSGKTFDHGNQVALYVVYLKSSAGWRCVGTLDNSYARTFAVVKASPTWIQRP